MSAQFTVIAIGVISIGFCLILLFDRAYLFRSFWIKHLSLGKLILFASVAFSANIIAAQSWASQVTLAWDANTESNIAGYILYYGTSSRNYASSVDVKNATQYTLKNLTEGQTYYFAASAYDTGNNKSSYSSELMYRIPDNDPDDGLTMVFEPTGSSYMGDYYSSRVIFDAKGIVGPVAGATFNFYAIEAIDILRLYYKGVQIGSWSNLSASASVEEDVSDIVTGNGRYEFTLIAYKKNYNFLYQILLSRENAIELEVSQNLDPNSQPVATFTASPTNGAAPLKVKFDASESYDPDGQIVSYYWVFGDGQTVNSGPVVTHVFTNPGAYNVKLTVTDDSGAEDTFITTVTVVKDSPSGNTLTFEPVNTLLSTTPYNRLRFEVSGVNGTVTGARIRVKASQKSYFVRLSDVRGSEIGKVNNAEANVWHEFDVSHIVTGGGQVEFGLETYFYSFWPFPALAAELDVYYR